MKLSVTERLLSWYDADIRELPWKSTRDPYKIWLSEIILQQTRVQQGTPYYLRFVQYFPDVESLANADIDDILKLWEGLGYYSRARNLHHAAKQVVHEFNGQFPKDYRSLLRLKGVGEYTAAAIASFAYDEPVAVVDGNVFRFLSRLFAIAEPIDSTLGKKKFKELAQQILNKQDPASHNQAIMDFGALMCSPKKPQCHDCPFSMDCVARNEDRIHLLPFKSKSIKKRDRNFSYYILMDATNIVIVKRSEKDIWQGLYQFPMIETTPSTLVNGQYPAALNGNLGEAVRNAISTDFYTGYKQVLSHQTIRASFHIIRITDLSNIQLDENWKRIPLGALRAYAYPRIIHSFLQENGELLPDLHML